jgi:hypothetical protein
MLSEAVRAQLDRTKACRRFTVESDRARQSLMVRDTLPMTSRPTGLFRQKFSHLAEKRHLGNVIAAD